MADQTKDTAQAQESQTETSSQGFLSDYLRAPQRKKRHYVVFATSDGFDASLRSAMESYVKKTYPKLTTHFLRSPKEIRRFYNREVVLFVIDDEYMALEAELRMVEAFKRKKDKTSVPFIFLTRRQSDLIRAYHRILAPYQELDDYVNYRTTPTHQLLDKISRGITRQNRRRSRRYKVDLKSEFFLLREEKLLPGRIRDLSLHGAMISCEQDQIFRERDQVRIHLPLRPLLIDRDGDFLKIAGTIQRVHIGGNSAAIRFEHVTERQNFMLTRFLISLTNADISKRTRRRSQSASA